MPVPPHGQGQLSAETVPPLGDASPGRGLLRQPLLLP